MCGTGRKYLIHIERPFPPTNISVKERCIFLSPAGGYCTLRNLPTFQKQKQGHDCNILISTRRVIAQALSCFLSLPLSHTHKCTITHVVCKGAGSCSSVRGKLEFPALFGGSCVLQMYVVHAALVYFVYCYVMLHRLLCLPLFYMPQVCLLPLLVKYIPVTVKHSRPTSVKEKFRNLLQQL